MNEEAATTPAVAKANMTIAKVAIGYSPTDGSALRRNTLSPSLATTRPTTAPIASW
jgi:hypothetical protein